MVFLRKMKLRIKGYIKQKLNIIGAGVFAAAQEKDRNAQRNESKNIRNEFYSNLELSNSSRQKLLVIGTISQVEPANTVEQKRLLYTLNLLKNFDYSNKIIQLYDVAHKKIYLIRNKNFLVNDHYKDELYSVDESSIRQCLYDFCFQIVLPDDNFVAPSSRAYISYAYLPYPKDAYENFEEISDCFDAILSSSDNCKSYDTAPLPHFVFDINIDLSWAKGQSDERFYKTICISDVKTTLDIYNTCLKNDFRPEEQLILYYWLGAPWLQLPVHENEQGLCAQIDNIQDEWISTEKLDTFQFLSEVRSKIFRSDAVIFADPVENFFYNPREALACGKIIFIPYSYGNICNLGEDDGVFRYDRSKGYLDLLECLARYTSMMDAVKGKYQVRRCTVDVSVASLDLDFLINYSSALNGLLQPNMTNLRLKLKYLANKLYYSPQGKIIAVPANHAGFCSVLNKQVSFMVNAAENEYYIPDWRLSSLYKNIYKFYGSKENHSFCYGKRSDGNVFCKFFQPLYDTDVVPAELYESDVLYNYTTMVVDLPDYNFNKEPFLTYVYPYNIYEDPKKFSEFRQRYNKIFKKHFKLQPHLQDKIDQFYKQNMKGKFCIGQHVRCEAHNIELRGEENSTFEKNKQYIFEILSTNGISYITDSWVLYIATDNDVVIEYFRNIFPENCLFFPVSARLSAENEKEYKELKDEYGTDVSGYELQQRMAASENTRSTSLGDDILIDCFLLSKCSYLIYKSSNVSTFVSYLNPDLNMVYCK